MLDLLIPMLLAAVAVAALARRQDLYAALLEGGLETVCACSFPSFRPLSCC